MQIDAKLEALRGGRPNSDEAKGELQKEISDFEGMKAQVERIGEMVAEFKKGKAPEREVVKATKTFRQTLQGWWETGHEAIMTTTTKSALFVSSVGLLTLMHADSPSAIAGATAIIMGKEIKGAAKRVGTSPVLSARARGGSTLQRASFGLGATALDYLEVPSPIRRRLSRNSKSKRGIHNLGSGR